MRDDDFIQVVLIVSGDTEEVQFVPLLIISDLGTTSGSLQQHLGCIHTSNNTQQQQQQQRRWAPW